ncbi:unnamed protein product [Clonostachys rosea f. rosea IK726]|jgi:hypothetical protein|uniref:Uncharacterized protein n=1 Tax=Clonostachys rosea f. rosea IK726 TaxID=1349383 RepID=A0ACA9TYJ7_BIOOC|nr:unnamed protein product [Clonostachys rosea f. rosea IK726]
MNSLIDKLHHTSMEELEEDMDEDMEQVDQQPEPWESYLFTCESCNKNLNQLCFNNDALLPFASSSTDKNQRIPKEALLSATELYQLEDENLEAHLAAQKGPLRCNECWFNKLGLDHLPSRFQDFDPDDCVEFYYPLPREIACRDVRLPTWMIRCTGCHTWQGSDQYPGSRLFDGAGACITCTRIPRPPYLAKLDWRDIGNDSYRVEISRYRALSIDWEEVVLAEPSIRDSAKMSCVRLFEEWEASGEPLRVWAALFHLREYFGEHRGQLENLFGTMAKQNFTFSRASYHHYQLQQILRSLETDASNKAADSVFGGEFERIWLVFSRVTARHYEVFSRSEFTNPHAIMRDENC